MLDMKINGKKQLTTNIYKQVDQIDNLRQWSDSGGFCNVLCWLLSLFCLSEFDIFRRRAHSSPPTPYQCLCQKSSFLNLTFSCAEAKRWPCMYWLYCLMANIACVQFTDENVWPRGFPLEHLHQMENTSCCRSVAFHLIWLDGSQKDRSLPPRKYIVFFSDGAQSLGLFGFNSSLPRFVSHERKKLEFVFDSASL